MLNIPESKFVQSLGSFPHLSEDHEAVKLKHEVIMAFSLLFLAGQEFPYFPSLSSDLQPILNQVMKPVKAKGAKKSTGVGAKGGAKRPMVRQPIKNTRQPDKAILPKLSFLRDETPFIIAAFLAGIVYIVVGSQYTEDCPLDPMIPQYLMGMQWSAGSNCFVGHFTCLF